MSKKMLINASHPEENRVAIVVDGILSELDIEIAGQEQTKGNIYKAVVVRVESGLQAAFVDYGAEKLGFLQIGEIHPNLYPGKEDSKSRPRINELLQRGQEILVQTVKEERGNKGAALTTFLSIPGRYMVLMPDSSTKGVSRKIQDDSERKKLKKTMAELDLPQRMGYIVRTAGIGKEKEELKRDFDYLVRLFEGIVARKGQVKAPAQLYRESNLVIRSIRDYFSSEMDEVLIDDQKVYQDAKDFFSLVMPELAHLVKQHRERRPIFSRYQIEEQIDTLAKNQIPLPSGGSIVIDQTEALVAIDVNSGKMSSESGIEATAAKTNLEAAAEVGRQLRLRDLGGLVVIDFIDMRDRKHIRDVEQELRKSLKDDKAKVTVGRISQFGLLEMSRQRLKPTLSVGSYLDCPHCQGKGRIKSAENQAVSLLRQIHAAASKGHIGLIEATVPLEVANDLLNSKRQSLVDLERRLNLKIAIIGIADMLPGEITIELHKREKSADSDREILPVTHANQIEMALAAASQPAPAEAEEESAESATEPVAEQGSEEPGERKSRRRRRRRRRKNDRSSEEASGTSQETTKGGAVAATAPDQGSAASASEPVPQAAEQEKDSAPSIATTTEPASAEAALTSEPSTSDSVSQEAAPGTTEPSPRPAEPQPAHQPEPPADASAGEPASEEKPKRRRSRRPAAKKAAKEVASDPAGQPAEEAKATTASKSEASKEEQPDKIETAAIDVAEEKPAAKKPARRSRKKTAPAEETPGDKTEAAPQDNQAGEEKPKPRPRRTRKKATSSAEPASTAATDSAEEKPKPSRPRKTAKAAEQESSEKSSEQPAAEKPKRGRPRKTAAKEEETKAENNSETSAAEKPKRGRPRKTAVKSEDGPATSAAAKEDKPKRRRRTTKKSDSPAEESPAE